MSRTGFTLIELLTALAIVALLSTLGWQGYQRERSSARRAEGQAALMQLLTQQQQQMARQGRYLAFSDRTGAAGLRWHSGRRPQDAAYLLHATACADTALTECIEVSAIPAGWTDTACGELVADSRGRRSIRGQIGRNLGGATVGALEDGTGCW